MSEESPLVVRVEHKLRSSPERVFDAWLDPVLIGRWMFGPALREEEILRIAVDARVGGAFSFLVRRRGQEIDHVGNYLEIDRPRRLVFTWGIAENLPETSRVSITIDPAKSADGTRSVLTLVHELEPKWADFASRVEGGWTKMLAALDALFESAGSTS